MGSDVFLVDIVVHAVDRPDALCLQRIPSLLIEILAAVNQYCCERNKKHNCEKQYEFRENRAFDFCVHSSPPAVSSIECRILL